MRRLILLMAVGVASVAAVPLSAQAKGDNHPSCPGHRIEFNGGSKTFVVPTPPDGWTILWASVKAGSENQGLGHDDPIYGVEPGDVLTHSSGKTISHIDLCKVRKTPPTTTEPPTPTTQPPDTTEPPTPTTETPVETTVPDTDPPVETTVPDTDPPTETTVDEPPVTTIDEPPTTVEEPPVTTEPTSSTVPGSTTPPPSVPQTTVVTPPSGTPTTSTQGTTTTVGVPTVPETPQRPVPPTTRVREDLPATGSTSTLLLVLAVSTTALGAILLRLRRRPA